MKSEFEERSASGLTRRTLLAGVGIGGLGVTILAACGTATAMPEGEAETKEEMAEEKKPEAAPAPEEVTIRYYSWFSERDLGNVESVMLNPFAEANPGATVELVVAPGSLVGQGIELTTMLAGGVLVDCFMCLAPPLYVRNGLVQPLDDLIKRDNYDMTQFARDGRTTFSSFEGKVYGLTTYHHGEAIALLYNRQLFTDAGVDEPSEDWANSWTWDEFRDTMQQLTKESGGKYTQYGLDRVGINYYPNTPMLWEGAWISDDFQSITCDSPEVIEAYESYIALQLQDRSWPSRDQANENLGEPQRGFTHFTLGKTGVIKMGSWQLGGYRDTTDIDWAFTPFPNAAVSLPEFKIWGYGVGTQSKATDLAWEFVKFHIPEDRWALLTSNIPARLAGAEKFLRELYEERPGVRVDAFINSLPLGGNGGDPVLVTSAWPRMLEEAVRPLWSDMIAGTVAPADGLKNVKPILENILAEEAAK